MLGGAVVFHFVVFVRGWTMMRVFFGLDEPWACFAVRILCLWVFFGAWEDWME